MERLDLEESEGISAFPISADASGDFSETWPLCERLLLCRGEDIEAKDPERLLICFVSEITLRRLDTVPVKT